MKFELVTGRQELSEMAQLIKSVLEHEGFIVHHIIDAGRMIKTAKGRVNPSFGYIVVSQDETIMFSMYDVVRYIDSKGLVPC